MRASSRTLAKHLKLAAQDFRGASEPRAVDAERLLGPFEVALGHVAALKAALASADGRAALGLYFDDLSDIRSALAVLDRRLKSQFRWKKDLVAYLERLPSNREAIPESALSPEAVLVCTALPALYDRFFGRVRRGGKAGAKGRFVEAACEALGVTQRRGDAMKKFCQRARRAAKSKDLGSQ